MAAPNNQTHTLLKQSFDGLGWSDAPAAMRDFGDSTEIICTAHPQSTGTHTVVFGVPLSKEGNFPVSANGWRLVGPNRQKIDAKITVLLGYRDETTGNFTSARIVRVQFEDTFTINVQKTYILLHNSALVTTATDATATEENYQTHTQYHNTSNPNLPAYDFNLEVMTEPAVFVTLPKEYYHGVRDIAGDYLLDTDPNLVQPWLHQEDDPSWIETFIGYAESSMNNDHENVSLDRAIQYWQEDYASWLYDRATTFALVFLVTGDPKWLIIFYRNAKFYIQHLHDEQSAPETRDIGSFDIRPHDLKFCFMNPFFLMLSFFGDCPRQEVIPLVVGRINNDAIRDFREGDWRQVVTERNWGSLIKENALAWALLGDAEYKNTAIEVLTNVHRLQQTPESGYTKDGAILHSLRLHEGYGPSTLIGSPWMSAILTRAMEYCERELPSTAPMVNTVIKDLGLFIANHALDDGDNFDFIQLRDGGKVPFYFANGQTGINLYYSYTAGNFEIGSTYWSDVGWPHSWDVLYIVLSAQVRMRRDAQDHTPLNTAANGLRMSSEALFDHWYRPIQAAYDIGAAYWQVAPPRRFSWMFQTAFSNAFYMKELYNS